MYLPGHGFFFLFLSNEKEMYRQCLAKFPTKYIFFSTIFVSIDLRPSFFVKACELPRSVIENCNRFSVYQTQNASQVHKKMSVSTFFFLVQNQLHCNPTNKIFANRNNIYRRSLPVIIAHGRKKLYSFSQRNFQLEVLVFQNSKKNEKREQKIRERIKISIGASARQMCAIRSTVLSPSCARVPRGRE